MRHILTAWLLLAACLLPARAGYAQDNVLHIGVLPNISARSNAALYQPVQAYLEKALGQRVTVFSAPDFKSFYARTINGEYDIVVIAPHMARLAQSEGGLIPLFGYSQQLRALLIAEKNSPIHTAANLRGKAIAIPDRLAVIPLIGIRMLRQQGLQVEQDFRLVFAASHNNAALTVLHGDAQAAIIGLVTFTQLSDEVRNNLRVIETSEPIPSLFVMASPKLAAARVDAFKKAYLDFSATPEGRQFFEGNGFGGLKPASEADLKKMDPYAKELQGMLKAGK
ncbi:MAG: phosphate/phosphite/phosphonate ABC transporter substrate-binding protein [Sulfuricella sp.]|nr:phosphate/phosphite/phosphonate ABC transporter substrate-binding protein [Sulfuricella sp.]